jgi:hypothetical protein
VLIINESSTVAILHSALLQLYPCYYGLHIIYFPTLVKYSTLLFSLLLKLVAQNLKTIWSTSIWSSRRAIAIDRFPMMLWCLSATMLLRVFVLVFCMTLFGDKYYIL